jgi:3-hydroxybutyryl-CoA dehydrogenase
VEERLGIAGSGVIATGVAATASQTGEEVLLWARSDKSAERARSAVAKICSKAKGGELDAKRVRIVRGLEELRDATFLIEAVAEHPGTKTSVLGELAGHAGDDAVIATTTSSLPISELARATGRPQRFVGFHVFNPVERMKLVELIFPDDADPDARTRARAVCEALGKTPVEVPDIPGFVVNRLLVPYLFSAVELMTETGMSAEDVDQCMTLGAGMPMGPIALLDFIGLDVAQAAGETIGSPIPQKLAFLVEVGDVGRKSGRGFYNYD